MQELHKIAIQDANVDIKALIEKEAIIDPNGIMEQSINFYIHLARNFVGVRSKKWETGLFKSREEAFTWLGDIRAGIDHMPFGEMDSPAV